MKALIFCAGNGTRLRPITNKTPKVMVEVGGKPVLEHLVDHLNSHGIHEIIVNLHHKPEKIMNYFGQRLIYFHEPHLLGEENTRELLERRGWLGDEYVVMNGDTLTNVNITAMISQNLTTYFEDDGVYAGTSFYKRGDGTFYTYEKKDGEFWIDMGTPDGLKKAKEHYEKFNNRR